MPGKRLNGASANFRIYDVVGQSDGQMFVLHAGLADRDGTQSCDSVSVIHMGPPLDVSGRMPADICGALSLNEEEKRRIRLFISRHAREHYAFSALQGFALQRRAAEMYCIWPHTLLVKDGDVELHTRFNCVGFVCEAYKRAGIDLVSESDLPPINLQALKQSYPQFARRLDSADFRSSLGLHGEGPWSVMLCGYLFHSLNRPDSEIRSIPYQPRESDAWFS